MAQDTQRAFIAELRREAEARGLAVRDDTGWANTGHLYVTRPERPLATPLATVEYSFQDGYASFTGNVFDESLRPRRVWHSAKYANGDLELVLGYITAALDKELVA
jgi:hypothetical protein